MEREVRKDRDWRMYLGFDNWRERRVSLAVSRLDCKGVEESLSSVVTGDNREESSRVRS